MNVINNKMFTKTIFKNKSKRKRNFIYHFLVERKPHEKINLLIAASVNIYQTKKKKSIPIVMKTCFSEGKLIKQFGNLLFLSKFSMTPFLVQILKTRNLPNCREEETMETNTIYLR